MIAVHMRQHDRIDLIGCIACRGQCGNDARAVQPGIEEDQLFSRVDERRCEEKLRFVGWNIGRI